MNWSDARDYLISSVKVVDPDLSEWREAFNIENVPGTLIDTHFQLTFNNITQSENGGNYVSDNINITLNIWKHIGSCAVDALDELLDKALCIRQEAIKPKSVEAFGINGLVESLSVVPLPIDETNDNIARVAIEFNIKVYLNV